MKFITRILETGPPTYFGDPSGRLFNLDGGGRPFAGAHTLVGGRGASAMPGAVRSAPWTLNQASFLKCLFTRPPRWPDCVTVDSSPVGIFEKGLKSLPSFSSKEESLI